MNDEQDDEPPESVENAVVHNAQWRLFDYHTNELIRTATPDEQAESASAATRDNGRGVILVDGRACYAEGP